VTVFLPGAEAVWDTVADDVEVTRYFTHAGRVVATTTGTDLADWTWLGVDHHGTTATHSVNAFTGVAHVRRMDPYGNERGAPPQVWPGQRGFVGGVHDPYGLVHVGARSYDPLIGRFISVDPILDVGDDQQINGYTYANANPIVYTDPTGLLVCAPDGHNFCPDYDIRSQPVAPPHDKSSSWHGPTSPDVVWTEDWYPKWKELVPSACTSGSDSRVGCQGPEAWAIWVVPIALEAGIDPTLLLAVLIAEVANAEWLGPVEQSLQITKVATYRLGVYSFGKRLVGETTGHKRGEHKSPPSLGWANVQEDVFNQVRENHPDVFGDARWTDMIFDKDLSVRVAAYRLADAQALAESNATPAMRRRWTPQEVAAAIYNIGDDNFLDSVDRGQLGPHGTTYATSVRRYSQRTDRIVCQSGVWGC
jgi:RHS repeat-associated protein